MYFNYSFNPLSLKRCVTISKMFHIFKKKMKRIVKQRLENPLSNYCQFGFSESRLWGHVNCDVRRREIGLTDALFVIWLNRSLLAFGNYWRKEKHWKGRKCVASWNYDIYMANDVCDYNNRCQGNPQIKRIVLFWGQLLPSHLLRATRLLPLLMRFIVLLSAIHFMTG